MSNLCRSFLSILFVLCFSLMARGQTPTATVTGNTNVCTNSAWDYTASYSNPNAVGSYNFSFVRGSQVLQISSTVRKVLWGSPGNGMVIVEVRDTSKPSVLLDKDTLLITVSPLPLPSITSNNRVSCQPLDEPNPQGNPPGQFGDSGCIRICAFGNAVYKAKGTTGSTFTWSAIGGTVTSFAGDSCSITWGSAGAGKVIVEETSVNGCKSTTELCITIVESPIASFGAMPNLALKNVNVCKGTDVIFIDKSTANPTSPIVAWRWDFGDGTYSNEKGDASMPVSHFYNTAGTYIVKLTVTNQCGCSTTDSLTLGVSPSPAMVVKCPGVVCEGSTYNYSVAASCPGGTWQVIGGSVVSISSSTLSVTWNAVSADGYGYVIYNPSGCPGVCPYPVSMKIPVIKASGVTIEGPSYLCVNKQYIYRMPQWPTTSYSWTASTGGVTLQNTDQPNEIVVTPNTAAGSVTLTCNYSNSLLGCTGTATKVIQIPGPASVSGPLTACAGGEWTYTLVGPNPLTASWKLVDPLNVVTTGTGPLFSAHFNNAGTYLLTVTGSFCPPDPLEIKVLAPPPPPDNIFGPQFLCRGVPTEYFAGTVDATNIFEWSVTNGTVNTSVGEKTEVTLTPGSSGPFTLSVIRVTKAAPHCPSPAKTKVLSLPNVNYDVLGNTTVCPSESYPYYVNYADGEAYDWSIYPQDMGSVQNASTTTSPGQGRMNVDVLWNKKPGIAKLVCRVRKCNEYYYDTLAVTIRSLAVTITMPDTACLKTDIPVSVNEWTGGVKWWTGLSSISDNDGNTTFNYGNPITTMTKYYVNVKVANPYGCGTPAEAFDSIVIKPAPSVAVYPSQWIYCGPPPPGFSVNVPMTLYRDLSFVSPTSYTWTRDGIVVDNDTAYTAVDSGVYLIKVTGPYGCDVTVSSVVRISECVQGDTSTPNAGCPGMANRIERINSDCRRVDLKGYHSIPSYINSSWIVPGSDSVKFRASTDSTASYEILKAGYHTFYYKSNFLNTFGNPGNPACNVYSDTTVFAPYIPILEIVPGCAMSGGMRTVTLRSVSSYVVPIKYYAFYIDGVFKQGGTSTTFTTTLKADSTYTFLLEVDGDNYPSCGLSKILKIPKLPVAGYTFARTVTCEKDAAVKFTNSSTPAGVGNLESLWDFSDGAQNNQTNPERVFDFPGSKLVKLVVTDNWGCKDSISQPVTIILKSLQGIVDITPPYPCENSIATANYVKNPPTTRTPTMYDWKDIKDNSIFYSGSGTTNIYKSGAYYVHVEDQYGCYFNTAPDTVLFVKKPRAYIFGSGSQCINIPFTLGGYVGQIPGVTYTWLRNGTVVPGAVTDELVQSFATTGSQTYRLIVSVPNPGGGYCADTSDNFIVTIRQANPVAATFAVLNCANYTLALNVTTPIDPKGIYNWNNGKFGPSVQVNYGGPFEVRYTDSFGCSSKYRFMAPKDLREYLWIFPTGCYSLCYTKPNIIVGPIRSFVQWRYLKNAGIYSSGSGLVPATNLNPGGPGTYRLYLQNAWCNVTSGAMDVDFNCTPGGGGTGMRQEFTEVGTLSTTNTELTLAPNPAALSTRVSYSYVRNSYPCYIEVYDAVGRVMITKMLMDTEGSFDIALENFTPGMYKVVMRQQGFILKQRLLSVTR